MRCSLVSVLLALLSRAALCARTSLLLKTHRPTDAMLKRICHLDVERRLSNFTAPFFLQYYLPDKKTEVMPFHEWCANDVAPVYTLHPQSLSDVFGEIGPDIHFRRWALGSVHELAFHAMHRDELDYDFLWVIEQDVAWQGNLYDIMGIFGSWPDDLVCDRVKTWRYIKRTGDPFKDGDDGWFAYHSGWANKGVANTTHVKCMKFMVRYSRRLLDVLVDEYLKKGQWAQDEWFASTICAHQLADFNRTPCTVRDYQEIPHLFSDRWWCCPPPFKEADWHYSVDNKPKLFHAMKF